MIIDTFCHIYPAQYLEALGKFCPRLDLRYEAASNTLAIINKESGSWVGFLLKDSHFTDPIKRIGHMDEYGVDIQVRTVALPGLEPSALGATPEETVRLAKIVNESIAAVVERHSDRFIGVAELPVLAGGEAVDEMDRAVNELGLRAVELYTHMGGMTPDSPSLYPIYERASRWQIPILIHPTNPLLGEYRRYEREYLLHYLFGWPYETTLALSRIVFSGLLDRFPNLRLISHHLGGMLSFYMGRAQLYEQEALDNVSRLEKPVDAYYRMMYHDTAVYGHVPALRCGLDVFGPEHIVFATDYPFGPEHGLRFLKVTIESLRRMGLAEDDLMKIMGGNAQNLFRL
jgi:predicted TIM-barrel fold metal-dependent hydrolase